ncbi:MAG: GNAT family N-acetyltransferase [Bacteroidota bacterium]|nr:GNAT family N-acetyltransferase [Bacteroidota bacterium]MDP4215872.1 GNAT family N-acetyltransferase [Bacteroidota bacterium]MDP4246649.1 GNAT family N-acetyltransferase [Bacteroidota bacterium]MDP4258393.1 GNAT family N-acetyltransferase [Bacteroidota bacterium]
MISTTVSIREYEAADQPFFEQLYRSWFTAHFRMAPEPVDEYVLTQPDQAILEHGGALLIAWADSGRVGCVALKRTNGDTQELTKMAVREDLRGQGIGKALCRAAIDKARSMGVRRIVLYTHSSLAPAILMYKGLRFKEVSLEPGTYSHLRCDTKMELWLDANHQ